MRQSAAIVDAHTLDVHTLGLPKLHHSRAAHRDATTIEPFHTHQNRTMLRIQVDTVPIGVFDNLRQRRRFEGANHRCRGVFFEITIVVCRAKRLAQNLDATAVEAVQQLRSRKERRVGQDATHGNIIFIDGHRAFDVFGELVSLAKYVGIFTGNGCRRSSQVSEVHTFDRRFTAHINRLGAVAPRLEMERHHIVVYGQAIRHCAKIIAQILPRPSRRRGLLYINSAVADDIASYVLDARLLDGGDEKIVVIIIGVVGEKPRPKRRVAAATDYDVALQEPRGIDVAGIDEFGLVSVIRAEEFERGGGCEKFCVARGDYAHIGVYRRKHLAGLHIGSHQRHLTVGKSVVIPDFVDGAEYDATVYLRRRVHCCHKRKR